MAMVLDFGGVLILVNWPGKTCFSIQPSITIKSGNEHLPVSGLGTQNGKIRHIDNCFKADKANCKDVSAAIGIKLTTVPK